MPVDAAILLAGVAVVSTVVAAVTGLAPVGTGYLKEKRAAEAATSKQKRQHDIPMRQSEVEQSLICTATNYDFTRDAMSNNPSPAYVERIQTVIGKRSEATE
jgi:hypothetical protein